MTRGVEVRGVGFWGVVAAIWLVCVPVWILAIYGALCVARRLGWLS